jgi:NADH:ubiquinone oxidoreductase subunit D
MKVTEFKGVPIERKVMRTRGEYYGYKTVRTREYKRLMKLIEQCMKEGGKVDFKQQGETVSATLHWSEGGKDD